MNYRRWLFKWDAILGFTVSPLNRGLEPYENLEVVELHALRSLEIENERLRDRLSRLKVRISLLAEQAKGDV